MGLVTEYYLDAALSELEDQSNRVESFMEQIGIKDSLETALFMEYETGDTATYTGDENYSGSKAVVKDTRPLTNLFTGLSPETENTYEVEINGRTITVSEDDLL